MGLFGSRKNPRAQTTVKCEGKGAGRRCCVYEKPFSGSSSPKRCWVTPAKRPRKARRAKTETVMVPVTVTIPSGSGGSGGSGNE